MCLQRPVARVSPQAYVMEERDVSSRNVPIALFEDDQNGHAQESTTDGGDFKDQWATTVTQAHLEGVGGDLPQGDEDADGGDEPSRERHGNAYAREILGTAGAPDIYMVVALLATPMRNRIVKSSKPRVRRLRTVLICMLALAVACLQIALPVGVIYWYEFPTLRDPALGRLVLNRAREDSIINNFRWLAFFGLPYLLISLVGLGSLSRTINCTTVLWRSTKVPHNQPLLNMARHCLFLLVIVFSVLTLYYELYLAFIILTSRESFEGRFIAPPVIDILKDVVALMYLSGIDHEMYNYLVFSRTIVDIGNRDNELLFQGLTDVEHQQQNQQDVRLGDKHVERLNKVAVVVIDVLSFCVMPIVAIVFSMTRLETACTPPAFFNLSRSDQEECQGVFPDQLLSLI